jgi:hypothetical protein
VTNRPFVFHAPSFAIASWVMLASRVFGNRFLLSPVVVKCGRKPNQFRVDDILWASAASVSKTIEQVALARRTFCSQVERRSHVPRQASKRQI